MNDTLRTQLLPVRWGLALGFVAVLYGWALGVAFGAGEDRIRAGFLEDAERSRALYVQRAGSEEGATAAIKRMDETAWRYFLRAHLHAGGIGGIAVGASLVLALLSVSPVAKRASSVLLGLGAVGYPLFWMLAGLKAPGMGTTAAAKESLRWLAWPSAGALVVGGVLAFALVVKDLFLSRRPARAGAVAAAAALAVALLAGPAAAQERGEGPVSLLIAYKADPAKRAAFRAHMEGAGAARFAAWQKEGVFADHRILFSSYVSPSWDMLVILRFDRYVDLARWRAIERRDPGGLSPDALLLGSPTSTQVADAMWEDMAADRDPATAVYLVIPYEYPDRARYRNYVDVYVLPQMKGWLSERATSAYTVFLNHNDAGPAWDSLLVLEYRDLAALGRRRVVVDKVRAELRKDAGWRTVSDVKGEFREEGEVVQAEPIRPR